MGVFFGSANLGKISFTGCRLLLHVPPGYKPGELKQFMQALLVCPALHKVFEKNYPQITLRIAFRFLRRGHYPNKRPGFRQVFHSGSV
jgi:hypothetical protein